MTPVRVYPSQRVNELRKSGRLEEARRVAEDLLQQTPGDRYLRQAFGWVLFSELKGAVGEDASQSAFRSEEAVRLLREYARNFEPAPDLLHSQMLRLALALAVEWSGFTAFVRWWQLESLRDEDLRPGKSAGGKPYPSLAERVAIALAKSALAHGCEPVAIDQALSAIDRAGTAGPGAEWLIWHRSRLKAARGRHSEALADVVAVVQKDPAKPWAWAALADALELANQPGGAACLAQALSLTEEEPLRVKMRATMAKLLAREAAFIPPGLLQGVEVGFGSTLSGVCARAPDRQGRPGWRALTLCPIPSADIIPFRRGNHA